MEKYSKYSAGNVPSHLECLATSWNARTKQGNVVEKNLLNSTNLPIFLPVWEVWMQNTSECSTCPILDLTISTSRVFFNYFDGCGWRKLLFYKYRCWFIWTWRRHLRVVCFLLGYFPGVWGLKADVSEPSIGSIVLGRWRKNNSGCEVSVYLYSQGMWRGSGRTNRKRVTGRGGWMHNR
jgi:hypothetical protein